VKLLGETRLDVPALAVGLEPQVQPGSTVSTSM